MSPPPPAMDTPEPPRLPYGHPDADLKRFTQRKRPPIKLIRLLIEDQGLTPAEVMALFPVLGRRINAALNMTATNEMMANWLLQSLKRKKTTILNKQKKSSKKLLAESSSTSLYIPADGQCEGRDETQHSALPADRQVARMRSSSERGSTALQLPDQDAQSSGPFTPNISSNRDPGHQGYSTAMAPPSSVQRQPTGERAFPGHIFAPIPRRPYDVPSLNMHAPTVPDPYSQGQAEYGPTRAPSCLESQQAARVPAPLSLRGHAVPFSNTYAHNNYEQSPAQCSRAMAPSSLEMRQAPAASPAAAFATLPLHDTSLSTTYGETNTYYNQGQFDHEMAVRPLETETQQAALRAPLPLRIHNAPSLATHEHFIPVSYNRGQEQGHDFAPLPLRYEHVPSPTSHYSQAPSGYGSASVMRQLTAPMPDYSQGQADYGFSMELANDNSLAIASVGLDHMPLTHPNRRDYGAAMRARYREQKPYSRNGYSLSAHELVASFSIGYTPQNASEVDGTSIAFEHRSSGTAYDACHVPPPPLSQQHIPEYEPPSNMRTPSSIEVPTCSVSNTGYGVAPVSDLVVSGGYHMPSPANLRMYDIPYSTSWMAPGDTSSSDSAGFDFTYTDSTPPADQRLAHSAIVDPLMGPILVISPSGTFGSHPGAVPNPESQISRFSRISGFPS